jgi:hypothetical protein
MFYRISTEVVVLHEYIVEAMDGAEAAARVASLSPNQTHTEPQVVMAITACDENGDDLPDA